jgi:shikimate 5-dehydrogenase
LHTLRAQHPYHNFRSNQKFPSGAASALVIGGGATTRSAVYALSTLGLNPIFLVNRDEEEVRAVIESFAASSTSNGCLELIHLRGVDVVHKYFGASMTDGGEERTPTLAIIVGAIPGMSLTPGSPFDFI